VSDWVLISGKSEFFGVTVFDVKNSYFLALLLFPGVIFLIIPYILEKWFSIGLTKKAAIKQYYTNLPSLLSMRYGRSAHYTYGQVKSAIFENKLNQTYTIYAFAMYLTLGEYDKNVVDNEEYEPSYMKLREELANSYFGGNLNFDALSMSEALSSNHDGVDLCDSGSCSDSGSGDSGGGDA
jgi:hypothetical protein